MSTYKIGTTQRWICPECGAQKDAKADLCIACYSKVRAKDIPSPEMIRRVLDLNKWNFSATGRYFRVSDNAVRKWCKKYNIVKE